MTKEDQYIFFLEESIKVHQQRADEAENGSTVELGNDLIAIAYRDALAEFKRVFTDNYSS